MKQFKKSSIGLIIGHILAILTYINIEIVTLIITRVPFNPWATILFYCLHIGFFYFTAFYFLPRLNVKVSSILLKILFSIIEIFVYSIIAIAIFKIFEFILKGRISTGNLFMNLASVSWRAFYFFFFALCFWYSRYSAKKEGEAQKNEILRLEAQENELRMETAFLRSQVNPHQLFNTFTVLYSRLLDKAPEEAKIILLLSDMMEYSLDSDVMTGKVKLGDDLLQIDREIRLQQVFYNGKLNIKYDSNIDELIKDVELPPLLFMNFVQNIFKHGDLTNASAPAVITINNYGNVLHFRTCNKIAQLPNSPSKNTGLINTRTRLEKYFPGRFELLTRRESDLFLVDLKISL